MRKGQVEFIAIIGIIAVVVVAVYYASTALVGPGVAPGAPTYTDPEQASVAETVNSFIRDGVSEAMRSIYTYGGYTEAPYPSVTYLGKEVSYWMKDGTTSYPNIRQNLVQGITSYINNNKANLEQSLEAQGVTLGSPTVSATVMPSQLVVSVNMPTTVKGSQMPQPYVVTIPTRLGEIEEFAKAMVEFEKTERFFEWATLGSMVISPLKQGMNAVPIWVAEVGCGVNVYRDINDVMPEAQKAVATTLAHTYMPGKVPLNIGDSTSFPKYGLPPIGGKEYSDLSISFTLPDSFELGYSNYQMSPNPIIITSKSLPMGMCSTEPVLVKHRVSYPAVSVVKDPLTGNLFRFAFDVYIKDNVPGEWSDVQAYSPTVQETICQSARCVGRMTLKDMSGSPVPDAQVVFMGCTVGRTDQDGFLEEVIPCGLGNLEVFRSGYGLRKMYSSSNLKDVEVTVPRMPLFNVHVYEVKMQNLSQGGTEKYFVSYPDGVTALDDSVARIYFASKENGDIFEVITETGAESVSHIPAGGYGISGMLLNQDFTAVKGEFGAEYDISEAEGRTLSIYIPTMLGYESLSQEERYNVASTLILAQSQCGLGPVTESEVEFKESCFVEWTE